MVSGFSDSIIAWKNVSEECEEWCYLFCLVESHRWSEVNNWKPKIFDFGSHVAKLCDRCDEKSLTDFRFPSCSPNPRHFRCL